LSWPCRLNLEPVTDGDRPRACPNRARLILVVLTRCAAGKSIAQAPAPRPPRRPGADQADPTFAGPGCAREVGRSAIACSTTRVFRTTGGGCNSCHDTSTNARALSSLSPSGLVIELVMDPSRRLMNRRRPSQPVHYRLSMVAGSETERRTDRWPLTLAIRADFDQTIKPYLILLDSS
jgi:hypothetical protein